MRPMKVVPLRLTPGADLRRALEAWMAGQQEQAGCVISAAQQEAPQLLAPSPWRPTCCRRTITSCLRRPIAGAAPMAAAAEGDRDRLPMGLGRSVDRDAGSGMGSTVRGIVLRSGYTESDRWMQLQTSVSGLIWVI